VGTRYLGYLCAHALLFDGLLVGQPLAQVNPFEPVHGDNTANLATVLCLSGDVQAIGHLAVMVNPFEPEH
jgi:hypothetical protein